MTEDRRAAPDPLTADAAPDGALEPAGGAPATPPKRLPLLLALLLLALLPAVLLGVWFGGKLHRVDDRPPKVKPPATRPRLQPPQPIPSGGGSGAASGPMGAASDGLTP